MTVWRYRIDVEYDGSGFSGWQIQRDWRTVQGELQRLFGLLDEDVLPIGAGRTDAGVHAIINVAHADLKRRWSRGDLMRALATLAPDDLRVLSVRAVQENFHARYSATARTYGYAIGSAASVLFLNRRWSLKSLPSEEWMAEASRHLLGDIDATSLAKARGEAKSPRCRVDRVTWTRLEEGAMFRVTANRFLWGMVRTIVGTLVRGYQAGADPGFMKGILERRDRSAAGESAPPQGLYLAGVRYRGEPDPAPAGLDQVARSAGLVAARSSAAVFSDGA